VGINRTEEFITSLKSLKKQRSIEALCRLEIEYLTNELSLTAKKRALTRYRNAVKEIAPNHIALNFLKLTIDEQLELKQGYKTQLYTDHTNLRPVDPEKLIIKGTELLKADSYLNLSLGLMLVTGRRATEILKTAQMSLATPDTVIFQGQLKTKNSDNAQTQPYEIPTLCDSSLVVEALAKLRTLRDFSDLTPDQVHSRSNKSLNESIKRQFKGLIDNPSPKDLRACYAQICHEYFCPRHISQTAYFAKILGHSEQDLATAQSYQDFYLVD
jgi:hypothetical protein